MNNDQLKAEMGVRGLKHSNRNKEEMIQRLEKSDKYDISQNNPLVNFVGEPMKLPDSGKPPPMKKYCDHFNAVDRANKYFYELQWPFKTTSFEPLVVWGMLNCVLVNCWSIYCELKGKIELSRPEFARKYFEKVLD